MCSTGSGSNPQIPAGIFSGSRLIILGLFSSFHLLSATLALGKAGRGMKRPLPGFGWLF